MKNNIIFGLLILFFSINAFAGKYPGLTELQCEEIDSLTSNIMNNMQTREDSYKSAYQILNQYRLLPVKCLNWSPDHLPCGPVDEKNIFHFFWSRSLISAECLEESSYISCVHPFICCSNYAHGAETSRPSNPLSRYFENHLRHLREVLGSTNDILNGRLEPHQRDKFPSRAEVFYLDYVTAREFGLTKKTNAMDRNQRKSFQEVMNLSLSEPIVIDTIGKSIAYKISEPENFTQYALSAFLKHMPEVVNGALESDKKLAQENLLSEIILSFLIEHAGDDPIILEELDELDEMINRYDCFGVIREMKENNLLALSFEPFLSYLKSSAAPFSSISENLNEIKRELSIDF